MELFEGGAGWSQGAVHPDRRSIDSAATRKSLMEDKRTTVLFSACTVFKGSEADGFMVGAAGKAAGLAGNAFLLGGIWGVAAIPCLCPACLAGPSMLVGAGLCAKADEILSGKGRAVFKNLAGK